MANKKCGLCEKHGKTHTRHAGKKSGRSGLKVLKPRKARVRRGEMSKEQIASLYRQIMQ